MAVQAAVIAELRVVNAAQARMIIEVQGRVAELERRLAKDSSTSSKPPSSDRLAKRPATEGRATRPPPPGSGGRAGAGPAGSPGPLARTWPRCPSRTRWWCTRPSGARATAAP